MRKSAQPVELTNARMLPQKIRCLTKGMSGVKRKYSVVAILKSSSWSTRRLFEKGFERPCRLACSVLLLLLFW